MISYDWLNLEDLGTQIPKQCDVKGKCKIRLLGNRHILIIFNLEEVLNSMLSKNIYYVFVKEGYSYTMRPLIYYATFKIEKETTHAMT